MDRHATLTVFRRVAELGSFTAAARDLGYSNAAVSKMVKDLEADLRAQLIVRTTRSLYLTDVGQAYYDRLADILDGLSEADEMVRSEAANPRGRLRVSAPMSFGIVTLSRVLPRFARAFPEIAVDLVMSDEFVDVIEDRFDVAIRGGRLEDSSLKARKLFDFERIVCAAPDYLARRGMPAAPADLSTHECVIYSGARSPELWHLQSGEETAAVAVSGTYRANSSIAVRDAAVEGLGLAFMPTAFARGELASGALVDALPGWVGEPQALHAVYPAHRETSRKLRVFVDFLAAELEREGAAG